MPRARAPEPTLKRSLSLPLLTLYGVGTTVGAGIYVLIGKVVGEAGVYAPLSFLLAATLAGLSALSFAEMSARFPASAGEAVYVQEGLGRRPLTVLVGLLVVAAGLVSCATLAHGFVGYMAQFVDLPDVVLLVALVGTLGLIAGIGITESVALAAVLTLLEVGGLVAIIGGAAFGAAAAPPEPAWIGGAPLLWTGVLSGAVLAFYAFIGFEDMVNVAEEVKDVRRTLPRAILATLVITSAFYVAISLIAVATVPPPPGLLATTALAGPENVKWPGDYKTKFTNYFNGDRTANAKQVIRVFANDTALQGAGADGKLPYGSVLVGELYSVKLDADGEPVESVLGRRVIEKFAAIVVMERGKDFDAEYSDDLKVGDWEFAVFSPDGKRLDRDVTGCRECHHPLTETEYVWSYEHLVR